MPEENPNRKRSSLALAAGVIVIALISALGFYLFKNVTSTPTPESPPVTQMPPVDEPVTYASSTMKISLTYPKDFTLDESYVNTSVNPNKPILGVKLTIPLTMATGTNLSQDSGISVEQLPRAKICSGDIFLAANVKPQKITDGTVTYSVATSSGAGAGNLYEEAVFALDGSSPCTAVRYFIHSTQIANYPPGTVVAFDRTALLAAFDTIRRSLVLSQ